MTYDAIVAGLGGVGSAALLHLARRGLKVLGIDRFPPGHDRGSSHGDSRVIRLAYYERPEYVPLLRRAYELWSELEAACGQKLYVETGLLQAGPDDGEVLPGVLASARRHGLEVERLSADEASRRFPGLRLPDGMSAAFERRAGYLRVEACVRAHAAEAERLGAKLAIGEPVLSWLARSGSVEVRCAGAAYSAARLVLAPGPWAAELLPGLGVPFEVLRKPFFWFEPGSYSTQEGCPVFLFERPDGIFYGIPGTDRMGLKAAEHSGGRPAGEPLNVDRALDPAELARVDRFLGECLPRSTRRLQDSAVCMYTMTPDRHFVVDRHPAHPEVAFAAGLSGHGFKFTPVLGEALAGLAMESRPARAMELGFLSLRRFSRR